MSDSRWTPLLFSRSDNLLVFSIHSCSQKATYRGCVLTPVLLEAFCQSQWKYLMILWGAYSLPSSRRQVPQAAVFLCSQKPANSFPPEFPLAGDCILMAHSVGDTALSANHFAHAVNCFDFMISLKQTELYNSLWHKDSQATQLWQSYSPPGWAEFLLPGEQTNAVVMELLGAQPQPAGAWEGCPTTCGLGGLSHHLWLGKAVPPTMAWEGCPTTHGTHSNRWHAAHLWGRYLAAVIHLL